MNRENVSAVNPAFRKSALAMMLLSATMLAGCATFKPPTISYDSDVPPLPAVPAAVTEQPPRPLHTPPAWTVAHGGTAANTPSARESVAAKIAVYGNGCWAKTCFAICAPACTLLRV